MIWARIGQTSAQCIMLFRIHVSSISIRNDVEVLTGLSSECDVAYPDLSDYGENM